MNSDSRTRTPLSPERPTATTPLEDFTVSLATPEDWRTVTEWGNAEGWNHGHQDAACFLATDPDGFFVGRLRGRPVAAVSLVNHSDEFAIWGHYLVDPEVRGLGYGRAVCKVARPHAGRRVIASEAMPQQVDSYRRSGLVPTHSTRHYVGRPRLPEHGTADVFPVTDRLLEALVDYDGRSFPTRRPVFLRAWLTAEGHRGVVRMRGDRITGYGVLRPAPVRRRIGPLVADTPEDAAAVLTALAEVLEADEEISVFAPTVPGQAAALWDACGLTEEFHVVRMYKGQPPSFREECVFAIGCLELG